MAFLAYGIGTGMVTGVLEATNPVVEFTLKRTQFIAGAALMLLNSAIVASIGLLLLPLLVRYNRVIAWSYLAARAIEAVALATGVMSLLLLVATKSPVTQTVIVTASRGNFVAYQTGMAVLGFGSLFFCALLYRCRLVPRFLAAWGLSATQYSSWVRWEKLQVCRMASCCRFQEGSLKLFSVSG